MFFSKNVPGWERLARIAAAAAVSAVGAFMGGPWAAVVVVAGVMLALTGFFGFCPLCAMAGRRLPGKS
jgi:hypothetical protein